MKLLKQIFYFRGIKIGKKEKIVSRMTVTILLLPFLLLFGLLTYLLFSQLSSNLYFLLVYFLFVVLISFIGTFILYRLLHIKFWFFKKLENRRLLLRHLTENRIFYPIFFQLLHSQTTKQVLFPLKISFKSRYQQTLAKATGTAQEINLP